MGGGATTFFAGLDKLDLVYQGARAIERNTTGGDFVDSTHNKLNPVKGADHYFNDAKRDAKAAGEQQKRDAAAATAASAKTASDAQASADSIAARDEARRRQRSLAGSRSGGRDTLLTGPSGLGDASGGTRKTLLGG